MSNAGGRLVRVKSEPVGGGVRVRCALCGEGGAKAGVLPPAQHERGAQLAARLAALTPRTPPPSALCRTCAAQAHQAFAFQQKVAESSANVAGGGGGGGVGAGAGAGPAGESLGARVRALRRRLHELTQHVDVFVVVGPGGPGGPGAAYTEDNIIAVERALLAAALDRQSPPPPHPPQPQPHQCALCPLSFATGSELLEHGRAHDAGGGQGHWCWQCGARCDSADELQAHAAAVHATADQPHPDRICYLCCNVFEDESSVWEHACSSGWACPACAHGVHLGSRAQLARHVHRAHSLRPATLTSSPPPGGGSGGARVCVCALCWRVLEDASALRDHMREHARSAATPCAHAACPLRFHTREEMVEHVKAWHTGTGAGGVPCVQCARVFDSARALGAHRRAAHPAPAPPQLTPQTTKQEVQSEGEEAQGQGLQQEEGEVEGMEQQEEEEEVEEEQEGTRVVYLAETEGGGARVLLLHEVGAHVQGEGEGEGEGDEVHDVEYLEMEALDDDIDVNVNE